MQISFFCLWREMYYVGPASIGDAINNNNNNLSSCIAQNYIGFYASDNS